MLCDIIDITISRTFWKHTKFFYSILCISLMRHFFWMMCCWIIAFSNRILFQTITYIFLFSACNGTLLRTLSHGFDVSSTKQDTRANRSLIMHRLQWCFPLMQAISSCEAIFIFSWVWKRTCSNRNRYNWNELNNANIAIIHYGKRNWYILRQLWRMYQMKDILLLLCGCLQSRTLHSSYFLVKICILREAPRNACH